MLTLPLRHFDIDAYAAFDADYCHDALSDILTMIITLILASTLLTIITPLPFTHIALITIAIITNNNNID